MSHERFYGVCEDKCPVEITNLVIRKRYKIVFETIGGGATLAKTITAQSLGITSNADINAIITPLDSAYDLDVSHYIDDTGNFVLIVTNKTSRVIKNMGFNVAFI